MKEENNGGSKKWSRVFRKKWFFPAVYLTVAALLLTFVVWYQNLENQIPEVQENQESTDTATDPFDEEAQSVLEQQEVLKMPVSNQDQAEIVTKFYDYDADQEAKESALVLYNSRYYQSTGIDFGTSGGETFDVTASLSGTVEKVKEDPLMGNVVVLSHENDLKTYYASLGEINVKKGTEVKQGDVVGTAGQNIFGKENGVHVHFEIRKDGEPVNPESYFNQPVSSIKIKEEAEEKDSGTTSEQKNSDEQSTTPDEETSGTQDDATKSEDGSESQEDPTKSEDGSESQEDPTKSEDGSGSQEDPTKSEDGSESQDDPTKSEDGSESQDDSTNQDEAVTPEDSKNPQNGMIDEGAESSASSASA